MTSTETVQDRGPDTGTDGAAAAIRRRGSLPRWAMPGTFAAAVVVAALLITTTSLNGVVVVLGAGLVATVAVVGASRAVEGRRKATDRLVTCLVTAAFLLALLPLISLLLTVVSKGLARLDGAFFNQSMLGILGPGGGAYHAILGTLIITAITSALSVPIGLLTAVYLVEYGHGRLKQALTFLIDVMTGIPSIVAGLFAYALFVIFFGPGVRMGLVGAVALSVLMIPVVVRSSEEVIKLVPNELREASYALGVPKWRTIMRVVLPTATAGLGTGVTLAIARVIGETAPLLVTVGITNATNQDPLHGRMATLPVFAYYQLTQPGVPPQNGIDRAWTAAFVLIAIVLALNLIARLISRIFAPKTGR